MWFLALFALVAAAAAKKKAPTVLETGRCYLFRVDILLDVASDWPPAQLTETAMRDSINALAAQSGMQIRLDAIKLIRTGKALRIKTSGEFVWTLPNREVPSLEVDFQSPNGPSMAHGRIMDLRPCPGAPNV